MIPIFKESDGSLNESVTAFLRALIADIESGQVEFRAAARMVFDEKDMDATQKASDGSWHWTLSPHQVLILTYTIQGEPTIEHLRAGISHS